MKSISNVAFALVVFDLRSGPNVDRVFSGPMYPPSQIFETCIRVSRHGMLTRDSERVLILTSMWSN